MRQCTRSGSAQPVFWSLPSAIHEFCRKKSATTCFAVRTSIHPTSAPTATEDDKDGNDKLTPFLEMPLETRDLNAGDQHDFLAITGSICCPGVPFMTSCETDCTVGNLKNPECGR